MASRAPSIAPAVWELAARMATLSRSPESRIVIVTSSRPLGERSRSISRTGGFASSSAASVPLRGERVSPANVACVPPEVCAPAMAPAGPNGSALCQPLG